MNISLFDQSRKDELTTYGEAVRLSNELRSKPAKSYINRLGVRQDTSVKIGINIETCSISDFKKWIHNKAEIKSQSLLTFVYRIISIRFPHEFKIFKQQIDNSFKLELELIESESKNEVEWVGLTGYQNNVRLDGSLTNHNLIMNKKNDGTIKFKSLSNMGVNI